MRTFFVCTILLFGCLASGCNYRYIKIPTGAMQPTIPIDSKALVDITAYSNGQPIERFDLVMHKAPFDERHKKVGIDENTIFIFRIIGFGGEKVELKNGQVFINNEILNEPFEKIKSEDNFGPILVPQNEFLLLGDNRPGSNDSRFWKPSTIKRENILGKVVKIF
jgi:signal peptidase I